MNEWYVVIAYEISFEYQTWGVQTELPFSLLCLKYHAASSVRSLILTPKKLARSGRSSSSGA